MNIFLLLFFVAFLVYFSFTQWTQIRYHKRYAIWFDSFVCFLYTFDIESVAHTFFDLYFILQMTAQRRQTQTYDVCSLHSFYQFVFVLNLNIFAVSKVLQWKQQRKNCLDLQIQNVQNICSSFCRVMSCWRWHFMCLARTRCTHRRQAILPKCKN